MPSDKHVVTQGEVAELLKQAKAPGAPEEKLRDLSGAMTMMAARYLYATPRPSKRVHTIWHEAQAAADKLRDAVGVIIAFRKACADVWRQMGRPCLASECEAEAEELQQLLDGLPEFIVVPQGPLWPDPKTGKRPTAWHLEAKLLLDLYGECVDPDTGISRQGPAVRFIQLALKRCGLGQRELPAIELALTPRQD
jgi:hypothetical protein